ncbi:MAG: glycine--tRNA ligase subunit alpha, partial [Pseudomonadota bacterium]
VGGIDCNPVSTELTYGLERIAMYIQGVENVFDLQFSPSVRYSELYHQSERDYSHYNFEHSDADLLVRHFSEAEGEAKTLTQAGRLMPAYDQALQASHLFNLLDARGVISVSERQGYILRVRRLVAAIAERYVAGLNSDG